MIYFVLKLISLGHEFLKLLLKFLSCFICLLLLWISILISPIKWKLTLIMSLIKHSFFLIQHRNWRLSCFNLLLLRSCLRSLLNWNFSSLLVLNFCSTYIYSIRIFLLKLHLIQFLNNLLIVWIFKRIAHWVHQLIKIWRNLWYELWVKVLKSRNFCLIFAF